MSLGQVRTLTLGFDKLFYLLAVLGQEGLDLFSHFGACLFQHQANRCRVASLCIDWNRWIGSFGKRASTKLGDIPVELQPLGDCSLVQGIESSEFTLDRAVLPDGNPRLCERPMDDILDTLQAIGIDLECQGSAGCLPVKVTGGTPNTKEWTIRGDVSSQFTSSLLLFASQQIEGPISIHAEGNIVSRPYIEMTLSMMRTCGLQVEATGDRDYTVQPSTPTTETIQVEVDASGMSYFLAAAALTGTTVRIEGIGKNSSQGDVGLARAFESMGCTLDMGDDAIELTGGPLRGIDIDMEVMPDVVLTLAAIACRADGITRVTNIANLRVKECDRIHAAAAELGRLGVTVEEGEDFLVIYPGAELNAAMIHTYDDHRVAMAFAILGLDHDPIEIEEPECVGKSFPDFWNEFERFRAHHNSST